LKQIIKNIFNQAKYLFIDSIHTDKNSVKVFWYRDIPNFGDAVTPLLLGRLTGKKVVWVNPFYYKKKHALVIGSILSTANRYSVIWGSGFMSDKNKSIDRSVEIRAVRGPKTRQKLLDAGIHCPEVYGDPALLLPKVYNPQIEKKYKLGIVAHYADNKNSWLNRFQNEKDVKILNVQELDPLKFIDDVLRCEKIASSSLHGIILADAYEIPSIWIKFSDNIKGGNFKFHDYFMSVGREEREALYIDIDTSLDDLYDKFYDFMIDIDLEQLLET